MTNTKEAWMEVGDHLSALALKLKLHAEQEMSEEGPKVESALDTLADSMKRTFEAMEEVCKDPALQEDMRAASEAFGNAIRSTMQDMRVAAG